MIIKKMKTDDEIRQKGYVHWKAWKETYPGLVSPIYLDNLTLERCIERAFRWPDNILVAKEGDKVIGFVGYGAYRNEELPSVGEVFSIYVLGEYHRKRVGYALMNAAMEKLAGYEQVMLWVLKGNEKAIRFYERYGFRFDGTEQEILIGEPNTELRMVLKHDEYKESL